MYGIMTAAPGYATLLWAPQEPARPQGCLGCFKNCRYNFASGKGNGDICVEALYWMASGKQSEQLEATTLLDQLGLNVYDVMAHSNLLALYKMGILGKGKEIDTDLPFDKYNTYEFIEKFTKAIAYREKGLGDDMAEGLTRAWVKWGRYEEDTKSGLLNRPQWGYMEHYDPRLEVEWSYGSLFGDRDINEHGVNWHVHWMPLVAGAVGEEPMMSAERVLRTTSPRRPAWATPRAGTTAKRASTRTRSSRPSHGIATIRASGSSRCSSATGPGRCSSPTTTMARALRQTTRCVSTRPSPAKTFTYEDSLEMGRKIWNIGRAIWTLQGRTREMEVFTDYVYDVPTSAPYPLPIRDKDGWRFDINVGRKLSRKKFEGVKDRFYALEGWGVKTGWPTRKGLESLGLGYVADELEKNKKLGS